MRASDIPGDFDHVLYTEEQVASRIREVAAQIDADYADKYRNLTDVATLAPHVYKS